jgi:hypothetical protein
MLHTAEVTRGWKKSQIEEFHDFYFPPDIMKSRMMIWVGHVTLMGYK